MNIRDTEGRSYASPTEVKDLLAKQRKAELEAFHRLEGRMVAFSKLAEQDEWRDHFEPHVEAELEALSRELEQETTSHDRSQTIRGEMKAWRHMLMLPRVLSRRLAEARKIAEDRAAKEQREPN